MIIPDLIVAKARTWLGTPFHHQARVKGKGCDCLGLVIGVAKELELTDKTGRLLASHDEVTYSRQPNSSHLIDKLSSLLDKVSLENASYGDIVVFKVGRNPQHLAILSNYDNSRLWLSMIHSDVRARCVVEHRMDDEWQAKLKYVFRVSSYTTSQIKQY